MVKFSVDKNQSIINNHSSIDWPKWRNWQTRGIQNPVLATGWGFESLLRQSPSLGDVEDYVQFVHRRFWMYAAFARSRIVVSRLFAAGVLLVIVFTTHSFSQEGLLDVTMETNCSAFATRSAGWNYLDSFWCQFQAVVIIVSISSYSGFHPSSFLIFSESATSLAGSPGLLSVLTASTGWPGKSETLWFHTFCFQFRLIFSKESWLSWLPIKYGILQMAYNFIYKIK